MMNHPRFRVVCAALAVASLLTIAPVSAQQDPPVVADPLVGTWNGSLRVGAVTLELALHVEREAGEAAGYRATFDSITQSATGIPVESITRDGEQVLAKLPRIGATYTAKLIEAEARLDGTWKQGGREFELVLTRGEAKAPRARPQLPKPPFPYRSVEVRFGHVPGTDVDESFAVGEVHGGVTLAGTLTIPDGDGPHPAAVMITGSGPQDRDETIFGHKPFFVIADDLARRGIAVLRFDDRGTGDSTGDFGAATSADFAADVRAALRFLGTRSDVDPARIGLIGHSEGGLIAPMVASGADRDALAFAVLLAPPGVGLRDVILHQTDLIQRAEGAASPDVAVDAELNRRIFDAMLLDDPDARQAAIEAAAEELWPELSEATRDEVGTGPADLVARARQADKPWMRWLLRYDPVPALRDMRCDVLVVFGGKDLQVDPAQNRPPVEAALAGRTKPATIVTLAGHNHLFQRTETGRPSEYGTIEETFSPEALRVVGEWLEAEVLARGR